MQRNMYDLVGKELKHKKFGMCQVVDVIDLKEYKILIKILEDSTMKKVLFSSNYFEGIEDYESLVLQEYVKKEKREYKKPDLGKYRRHSLVKAIDAKELRIRVVNEESKEKNTEKNTEEKTLS